MAVHVDADVGVEYQMDISAAIKSMFAEELKRAVQEYIDWVKEKGMNQSYPKVWRVPVYREKYYQYPRKEGETEQLRKSLTAAFFKRFDPYIYWNTPYASHVVAHGRVRTGRTSAIWHKKLKDIFAVWLRYFLRKHLPRNIVSQITIHARPYQ